MRDLREYAKQTNIRLAIGAVLLLFVVGVGLITWIYGGNAGGLAFTCLLAALAPVALIVFIFFAIDWILRHARPK